MLILVRVCKFRYMCTRVVDNVPQTQLLESVNIFINPIYFPLFSCQTDSG